MGSQRHPKQTPQPLVLALPARHAERMVRAKRLPLRVNFAALFAGVTQFWTRAPRLADRLDPKQNSFSVLRLMMALAVLISHTIFLASGSFLAEPLVASTGYSLGQYGVQGFFILSGILVTQSLFARQSLWDYGRARAMRIFPALAVCVAVTVLAVGPALSLMGANHYFSSPGVIEYVAKTLSLSTGSAQLPGLFVLNPASGVVNQSLWTLKYEAACYVLLGGLATVVWRAPSRRLATILATGAWLALLAVARPTLTQEAGFLGVLSYFALFFGTGVAAFLGRKWLRLTWQPVVVLCCVFVFALGTEYAEIASALFVGYTLLWLSTLSFGPLRAFANANDYSYGTYIYGFPVAQAILAVWPTINLFSLLVTTAGLTLLLAFMSWTVIERPALRLVQRWRTAKRAVVRQKAAIEPVKTTTLAEQPGQVVHAPAAVRLAPAVMEVAARPATEIKIAQSIAEVAARPRPTLAEPIVIRPRHPELAQPVPRPIDKSRLKQRLAMIAADRPRAVSS